MGSESSKKAPTPGKQSDVVLIYGRSDDGQRYDVLRQRGSEIQAGTMRQLEQGRPIHGELVRLKARQDSPVLFDVEVEHDARVSRGRPAKVASEEYRRGWESIWSTKRADRTLN